MTATAPTFTECLSPKRPPSTSSTASPGSDATSRPGPTYRERGVFFTYEEMCAAPERVASRIQALVPELDDLDLRQRLPVKGMYHEMLTDMNARQIARLDAGRIEAFNRVFRAHRDVLDSFGYDLMVANRVNR